MSQSLKPETLIPTVSLILVVLITYFLSKPQAAALQVNKAELTVKLAEEQALNEKIVALQELATKLPQFNDEITRLAIAFPETEQSVEALIQAQALSQKAGMTVKSLVPAVVVPGSMPVTMTLQGGYDRLGTFFQEINNNLRPIKVDTIALTAGSEQDAGVMNISVNAGFLFNGAAVPTADAAAATTTEEPLPSTAN